MRCSPTQKNPLVWGIVAALLVLGGVSYAIPIVCRANGIGVPAALFQFLTVLSLVAAVFVAVRYQMTGFVYLIRPRSDLSENGMTPAFAGTADSLGITHLPPESLDFVVLKSQGSRAGGMECVLSLSDLVAVYPLSKTAGNGETRQTVREKYQKDGYTCYDYTLTLGLDAPLALVFLDGNRYTGIFIEPDEAMRSYFMSLGKTGR